LQPFARLQRPARSAIVRKSSSCQHATG
jgi:hypothetical protein